MGYEGKDNMNQTPPMYLVLFFLQDKNYIPRFNARCLVSFSSKGNFLAMLHAFVHMHLQNLHLLHDFLALAFFTAVFLTDHLTWGRLNQTQDQRSVQINKTRKCLVMVYITVALTLSITISTH